MAAQPLSAVPNGSIIFVDANILIYALEEKSRECRDFLGRCSREELTGVMLWEVLHEATHVLMLGEAQSKGLIKPGDWRSLRKNPEWIKELEVYWTRTEEILALNLLFLPTGASTVRIAQAERKASGLLTNDSLIVAGMREYGISLPASSDSDFERVKDMVIFKPSDAR